MVKKARSSQRREESLSRESIIEASIELLDSNGESGLTFRALSEHLATGPGAIYWHIANKNDLLTAACDAVIARTISAPLTRAKPEVKSNAKSLAKSRSAHATTPQATIRAIALGLFDAIDAHPWVGSALTLSPGQLSMVRILERLGEQVRALGVSDDTQWAVMSALINYILGVAGRNAANGQLARARGLDRSDFLDAVSTVWSQLDPDEYPFVRSIAGKVRAHDDRVDFLAGIDLILKGMEDSLRNR